jgi:hypothetical protein
MTPKPRHPRKNVTQMKGGKKLTLLEEKPSIYNAIVEGIRLGLTYTTVAKKVGVHYNTLNDWMKRSYKAIEKLEKLGLSNEQIDELAQMGTEIGDNKEHIVEQYGDGVFTVVEMDAFWLGFGYDVRKADVWAEGKMLEVIRGAAIGEHSLTERRTKSVVFQTGGEEKIDLPAEEVTIVTRELKPQWQAAAWLLERRHPERYTQRKIVQGELPKDIPYEVFMTAKTLLQLPKVELDRIITALKEKLQQPRITNSPALLTANTKGKEA